MAPNDRELIIDNFKEQFTLIRQHLNETKEDLSAQIRDIRTDINNCLLRITDIEKKEIMLQLKSEQYEKARLRKAAFWQIVTNALIYSIVPIIITLFYSVVKIAAKLNINLF